MTENLIPGRYRGVAVAHLMMPAGPSTERRYVSLCALYWTDNLRPASDALALCNHCQRKSESA